MTTIVAEKLRHFVDGMWRDEITPCLADYIRIPNKSPAFDPDWESAGQMDSAVDLLSQWARTKLSAIPGASLSIEQLPGRTPVILIEIPGTMETIRCCGATISFKTPSRSPAQKLRVGMRTLRMRSIAAALFLFTSGLAHPAAHAQPITSPPAAANASPEALLAELIAHSRHTGSMVDGRLRGGGAEFLRQLGANSQFVLLGEEHGNAGITRFAAAYWHDLSAIGFEYAAFEIDPYMADSLVRQLRAGGPQQWGSYLQARGGAHGAPFMRWAPEVELAHTVIQTSVARRESPIWGLDQVFNGSAAARFDDIAEHARSGHARTLAARLAEEGRAAASQEWFASLAGARLIELRGALSSRRDERWAELVDAMVQSHRIYAPFSGRGGEAYLANEERENLMKRNFLAHYRAALQSDRRPPRVMLKFGSFHMMRGATPTHVQGLGGFVTEFAVSEGSTATTILLVCGPRGAVEGEDCSGRFDSDGELSFLGPVSSSDLTIFDLRVWRLRPRRWESFPAELRALVDSYDALVIVPGGPQSSIADGLEADG